MTRFVRTNRGGTRRRGFTLVELLIAITIFAIGLLGLGALFPAVIAKQRSAIDATMGAGAIDGIVSQLKSGELVPLDELANLDPLVGTVHIPSQFTDKKLKQWLGNNPSSVLVEFDDEIVSNGIRGDMVLPSVGTTAWNPAIPVAARLSPQPFDTIEPQYVWDLLIRRQPATDRLEVAVFMRRIDTGIQAPKGMRLSNVLTGVQPQGMNPITQRLPIEVVDAMRNFRPVTGSAQGEYSVPVEVKFIRPPAVPGDSRPDGSFVRVNDGGTAAIKRAIGKRGQKLLCDDGIVREVIAVRTDRMGDVLTVTPPFTFVDANGAFKSRERAVFTPQVPAQVRVFTVGE